MTVKERHLKGEKALTSVSYLIVFLLPPSGFSLLLYMPDITFSNKTGSVLQPGDRSRIHDLGAKVFSLFKPSSVNNINLFFSPQP